MPSTPDDDPKRSSSSTTNGPLAPAGVLARNTFWNLAGTVLPALAAVGTIPLIIARLGDARFGVLTLAWGLGVLFTLSDLGLSRATTVILARDWASSRREGLGGVLWASIAAHVGLGLLAAAGFAAVTPWLIDSVLGVPTELAAESRTAFLLLAASIPVVLAGNPLRSVLETTQRFRALNMVRLPISLINYVGPLLVTFATPRLDAVIGVIVASRVAGLLAHIVQIKFVAPDLLRPAFPSRGAVRSLVRNGAWLGATGLALPGIAGLDRLAIGARLSLADMGYYGAPYEVVTKLWFLSGSMLLVLFPVFSALHDVDILARAYWRTLRLLCIPAVAAATLFLAFSPELFSAWLGEAYASATAPVAQWLAVGVAASIVGQIPLTFLQCRGRPDVPALVQLAELPLYGMAVWWVAGSGGVTGVAMVWTARAAIEALLLFGLAAALLPSARPRAGAGRWLRAVAGACVVLGVAAWLGGWPADALASKVAAFAGAGAIFLGWAWWGVLEPADRAWIRMRRRSPLSEPS